MKKIIININFLNLFKVTLKEREREINLINYISICTYYRLNYKYIDVCITDKHSLFSH